MVKEIKTLTGIRGVAAVIVMLYHFIENDSYYQGRVPGLIGKGYLGVDVFFVLSGFVMALSYARYFESGLTFAHYKTFMAKRIARVYPLYFFITILFSIKYLLNLSGIWKGGYNFSDFIANLMMIQGWGFGFSSVAGATWSLSTECFAYLIFPLLVLAAVFGRVRYAVLIFAGALILLYLVAASHLGVNGALDVVSSNSIMPLLRCLAGFCLGLLGFRLSQFEPIRRLISSSVFLIALLIMFVVETHFDTSDLALFAFFPPLIVALYYQSSFAKAFFANRAVYHLGLISYSLYLIHPLFVPIKTRLEPVIERHIGVNAHMLTIILVIFLTWGSACLLYRFIEMSGRIYLQKFLVGKTDPIKPPFEA